MRLDLTKPELAKFIDEKVSAGEFPSREAVVEDALLRMMASEIELTDEDLRAIEQSRQEFGRGDVVDFKDFAARMRTKYGIDK